jgi:hypothetical protein
MPTTQIILFFFADNITFAKFTKQKDNLFGS